MKKLIILFMLLVGLSAYSQGFAISVYQDIKLAVQSDDHGNSPFTADFVVKAEFQTQQQKIGYLLFYPQVELADLAGGFYERYAAGIGYKFTSLLDNFDITASYNYGIIRRFKESYFGSELQAEASYKIYKGLRISALCSFTERQDIGVTRFNTYLGLKYQL